MVSMCTNIIENLAIWGSAYNSPEVLKKMTDLPLRMLSVDVVAIDSCPFFQTPYPP